MVDLLDKFQLLVSDGFFCIHPHSWMKKRAKHLHLMNPNDALYFGELCYRSPEFRRGCDNQILGNILKTNTKHFYRVDTKTALDYENKMKNLGITENSIRCTFEEIFPDFKSEVNIGSGCRIDLLSDSALIEVKNISNWKHALGQVLTYKHYMPGHTPHLLLFGKAQSLRNINEIKNVCNDHDVIVNYVYEKCSNNNILRELFHSKK